MCKNGFANADSMPVQISGDGGATWVTLEDVVENAGAWVEKSFRVADYEIRGNKAGGFKLAAREVRRAAFVSASGEAASVPEGDDDGKAAGEAAKAGDKK